MSATRSEVLYEWLKQYGIVPATVRKFAIVAEVGEPVKLFLETIPSEDVPWKELPTMEMEIDPDSEDAGWP